MNPKITLSNKTFEEEKAQVAAFNLIDDVFFEKIVEDKGACEELLQIILRKPDLRIKSNIPQFRLQNINNRSVILDLLCTDNDNNAFFVEMQKENEHDDYGKRVRYYVSNIDTRNAEKGCSFRELPDVYSIFISAFDIFGLDETVYYIDRVLRNKGTVQNNGIYEIYINAKGKDESYLSELMKYFLKSNGYNPSFPRISDRVQFFKAEKEGIHTMCKVMEDYAKEYAANSREEGRVEGRMEGRVEGRVEGIAIATENAKKAIEKLFNVSPEEFDRLCKEQGIKLG